VSVVHYLCQLPCALQNSSRGTAAANEAACRRTCCRWGRALGSVARQLMPCSTLRELPRCASHRPTPLLPGLATLQVPSTHTETASTRAHSYLLPPHPALSRFPPSPLLQGRQGMEEQLTILPTSELACTLAS
jgi:hypothetical protein